MNYYELLGVSHTASIEEIKKAYREKAKQYHPDVNKDKNADNVFKEIHLAYETLVNPSKRAQYNRKNPFRAHAHSGKKFDNLFEEFFGGNSSRGMNVRVNLEISFEESYFGCTKNIVVHKKGQCRSCGGQGGKGSMPCPACQMRVSSRACQICHGSGYTTAIHCMDCMSTGFTPQAPCPFTVNIPPGIQSGHQISFLGEGEAGYRGLSPGNLYVVILVKPHELFSRRGQDMVCETPVSYTQLIFGDKIVIPTLDGTIECEIPPKSIDGHEIRIKDRGFNGGDFVIITKLEIPTQLEKEYEKVLKELKRMEEKFVSPKIKEFKGKVNGK